jgi:hypothetical protein
MILIISIVCVLGACGNNNTEVIKENLNISTNNKTKNIYDPHIISVGDKLGEMTAKSINVKDIDGDMTLMDIKFESDPIEITGAFDNFMGDYHVLYFTPNEESKAKFPHHNLFEYGTTLYFFDEEIFKKFEGYKKGIATIIISGYHEVVSYKDDISQNSNLIEVINIQSE